VMDWSPILAKAKLQMVMESMWEKEG
jgi:hypothetical protein